MNREPPDIVEFGRFELDRQQGELRRRGQLVALQDLPLRLLLILLERPGETVSNERLKQRLWPGVRVDFAVNLAKAVHKLRRALNDSAEDARYVETVRGQGYRFVAPVRSERGSEHAPVPSNRLPSLAIVPFESPEGTPTESGLGFAIADDLVTRLANLTQLIVRPMSAVLGASDRRQDALAIGQQLAVTHVLEGTLRSEGKTLRLNARMVSVAEERLLWGDSFDPEIDRPLATQSALADRISATFLDSHPPGHHQARNFASENQHAQLAYLRGRHWFERRFESGFKVAQEHAVACFEEAVDLDPGFAAAYAGIALAWTPVLTWALIPLEEGLPALTRAADRARDLAPELPAAHEAQAMKHSLAWDWDGEERSHRRAIELDPRYLTALTWYHVLLQCQGRWSEAIAIARRALEIDPGGSHANLCFGTALHHTGDDETSLAHLRAHLEARPTDRRCRMLVGHILLSQGRTEQGLAEIERVGQPAQLAWALGVAGRKVEARRLRDSLEKEGRLWLIDRAGIYTGLGELNAALDCLDQALAVRLPSLMLVRSDHRLAALHGEPRFDDLLRRIGLPGL